MSSKVPKSYNLALQDGEITLPCRMGTNSQHQLSIRTAGDNVEGTLTIYARSPGSDEFESIPDGVIDLADINTVLFKFCVAEYKVALANTASTSSSPRVSITDIPIGE